MPRPSPGLDPYVVAERLRHGARLFVFMDARRARLSMHGRLPSDGSLVRPSARFADEVRARLEVLRALNRRRAVVAKARRSP